MDQPTGENHIHIPLTNIYVMCYLKWSTLGYDLDYLHGQKHTTSMRPINLNMIGTTPTNETNVLNLQLIISVG